MIVTITMLQEMLNEYSDYFGKVRRMVEKEELIPVTKGIYETSSDIPGYVLSPVIYGPSYLSFNYALSKYGLIPEGVYEYTNATCLKGKKKHFSNFFGNYSYRDIPVDAYHYEINLIQENNYYYWIASKEKALCDSIYAMPRIKNQKELKVLLFDNMRIDHDEFSKLDHHIIHELSSKYHSNNVKLLNNYIQRYHYE